MTMLPTAKLLWYDARGTDGTDPARMHAVYECDGKHIVIRADEAEPEAIVRAVAANCDVSTWAPHIGEIGPGQGYLLAIG